jgi:hypothetical protein
MLEINLKLHSDMPTCSKNNQKQGKLQNHSKSLTLALACCQLKKTYKLYLSLLKGWIKLKHTRHGLRNKTFCT